MYQTMPIDSSILDESSSVFLGAIISFIATYAIAAMAIAILTIIGMWLLYRKAGKPGWASIVPIYNIVVLYKIVGISPWLILLYLIPFVNVIAVFVLTIIVAFRLAKSFGKDIGWGFGLWLLPTIFYLILAFGNSEYVGPNGERAIKSETKPEVKEEAN